MILLEWLSVAALVTLTLLLAKRMKTGGSNAVTVISVVVTVLASVCLAQFFPQSPIERLEKVTPVVVAENGYTGSTSCKSCHPGEHATWHRSYHRTMTQVATPDAVRAPWGMKLPLDGVDYVLFRKGNEFWANLPDPDIDYDRRKEMEELGTTSVETAPLVDRQIVMTTGSHHLQTFWVESHSNPGELRLFPWVYHIRAKRWMPYEDSFLIHPDLPRTAVHWNSNCVACHTVAGNPGFNGSKSDPHYKTKVVEHGISCEACHGPGKAHVEKQQALTARYNSRASAAAEEDDTIINPANLGYAAQSRVCGQCHSFFQVAKNKNFFENGFQYTPGDRLSKTHDIIRPNRKHHEVGTHYWKDGTARIGGREYLGLTTSPCFHGGKISCLSCHSMHDSDPNDQLAARMNTNHACLQCHDEIADVPAHTHHAAGSEGSSCYNCHMPYTSYALMGSIRSHQINSPRTADLNSDRPNACNLCHQDKSLKWTADHLQSWYGQDNAELKPPYDSVAAGPLWMLQGNAAQRTLVTDNLRRRMVHEASGVDWQTPFLSVLLEDPYDAVRFVAGGALRSLPQHAELKYDYLAPAEQRAAIADRLKSSWRFSGTARPELLQLPDGKLDLTRIKQILDNRDNAPIMLFE